jgi:hypothetical protein
MWLRKASGGSTIPYGGDSFFWPHDGAVIEVPGELGLELLAIPGAGYSEAEAPGDSPEEAREVTEPAPSSGHAVTEPAPPGDDASPATPRTRGGTRTGVTAKPRTARGSSRRGRPA